jgi:hypothetical protein
VTESVRIRDMPGEAFGALLRSIGPEIGRLATRGDRLAMTVLGYFMYAHEHPNDPEARMNVRVAVEDYMNRDLRIGEQYELGSRFGHRLPEPEKEAGTRIFVPESIIRQ